MAGVTVEEFVVHELPRDVLGDVAEMMTAFWQEVLPHDPAISPAAARAALMAGPAGSDVLHLLGRCDGVVAGVAAVAFAVEGPHVGTAQCSLEVGPDHRRRGVGSALLAQIVAMAVERGCRSIVPWGLRTPASTAFWEAYDLPEVQVSRRSRVAIADIDRSLMEAWRSTSTAEAHGYELRSFVGACPNELLEAYVRAQTGLADAPTDDLDLAPPGLTGEQIREFEATNRARGITTHAIVALDPAGAPAGVTEITVSTHTPELVAQQVTTTLAEHRRRGIGRWMKAAMYFHIIEHLPDATMIETGNADSNAPMLALNDAMGFVPVLAYTVRQGDLEAVADALSRRC